MGLLRNAAAVVVAVASFRPVIQGPFVQEILAESIRRQRRFDEQDTVAHETAII